MSQVRVEDVVSALNEAGIPALAAYPGSASPEVEAAVAAQLLYFVVTFIPCLRKDRLTKCCS